MVPQLLFRTSLRRPRRWRAKSLKVFEICLNCDQTSRPWCNVCNDCFQNTSDMLVNCTSYASIKLFIWHTEDLKWFCSAVGCRREVMSATPPGCRHVVENVNGLLHRDRLQSFKDAGWKSLAGIQPCSTFFSLGFFDKKVLALPSSLWVIGRPKYQITHTISCISQIGISLNFPYYTMILIAVYYL